MNDKDLAGETVAPEPDKFFTTPLIIIFVTVFIDLIGFGMVIPLLPYYANTDPFDATPRDIGFLVASYSLMQFEFSWQMTTLSFAPGYGRFSPPHATSRSLARRQQDVKPSISPSAKSRTSS